MKCSFYSRLTISLCSGESENEKKTLVGFPVFTDTGVEGVRLNALKVLCNNTLLMIKTV